jgi:hypothetical protein
MDDELCVAVIGNLMIMNLPLPAVELDPRAEAGAERRPRVVAPALMF